MVESNGCLLNGFFTLLTPTPRTYVNVEGGGGGGSLMASGQRLLTPSYVRTKRAEFDGEFNRAEMCQKTVFCNRFPPLRPPTTSHRGDWGLEPHCNAPPPPPRGPPQPVAFLREGPPRQPSASGRVGVSRCPPERAAASRSACRPGPRGLPPPPPPPQRRRRVPPRAQRPQARPGARRRAVPGGPPGHVRRPPHGLVPRPRALCPGLCVVWASGSFVKPCPPPPPPSAPTECEACQRWQRHPPRARARPPTAQRHAFTKHNEARCTCSTARQPASAFSGSPRPPPAFIYLWDNVVPHCRPVCAEGTSS